MTLRHHHKCLLVFVGLVFLNACQKKCQPPEGEPFRTITATPWRLVETTDSSVKGLSNTSFLVFEFATTFSGNIKKVGNNVQNDDPVKNFLYQISPSDGVIWLKTSAPTASDSLFDEAPPSTEALDTKDATVYTYDLGRELTLQTGNLWYRFVPFKGIIEPDNECVF